MINHELESADRFLLNAGSAYALDVKPVRAGTAQGWSHVEAEEVSRRVGVACGSPCWRGSDRDAKLSCGATK
jgi:hypothetical protein